MSFYLPYRLTERGLLSLNFTIWMICSTEAQRLFVSHANQRSDEHATVDDENRCKSILFIIPLLHLEPQGYSGRHYSLRQVRVQPVRLLAASTRPRCCGFDPTPRQSLGMQRRCSR